MSLGLTLLFDRISNNGAIHGYDRLDLRYAPDLMTLRETIKPFAVPLSRDVEWYSTAGIEILINDPFFNEPLTVIAARDLAPLLRTSSERHAEAMWLVAVAAFVEALPPWMGIVLYWS